MIDYGRIIVRVEHHPTLGVDTFTAEWEGPDTILISEELMDEHRDPPFRCDGDDLTICQYHLKITGQDWRGDYIAQRVPAPAAGHAADVGEGGAK